MRSVSSFGPKPSPCGTVIQPSCPLVGGTCGSPRKLVVESLVVLKTSSNQRRKWNHDLASPGGPQPSQGAALAGGPRGPERNVLIPPCSLMAS